MNTFYVETYRPPFPERGVKIRVHREKNYSRDVLSPNMTAVFEVQHVNSKEEAIACVVENAAGHKTCVRRIFGGS